MCDSSFKTVKVVISNKNRTIGNENDFIYQLPEPIFNCVQVKLVNCIIENQILNVNPNNNKIKLSTYGGLTKHIFLEPGIYSKDSFLIELRNELKDHINSISYTSSKHILFVFNQEYMLDLSADDSASQLLGLDKKSYTVPANAPFMATYPYNIATPAMLFLQCEQLENNIMLSGGIRASNSLILDTSSFSTSFNSRFELSDNEISRNVDIKQPFTIYQFNFRVIDSNGKKVVLNNGEMVLVLQILLKV